MFLFKTFVNWAICFPVSFFYKLLWNNVGPRLFEFASECTWIQSYFITLILILFGIGIRIRFDDIKDVDDDHNSACAVRLTIDIG